MRPEVAVYLASSETPGRDSIIALIIPLSVGQHDLVVPASRGNHRKAVLLRGDLHIQKERAVVRQALGERLWQVLRVAHRSRAPPERPRQRNKVRQRFVPAVA